MSTPIAALLAAALYQSRDPGTEQAIQEATLSLLARACEGDPMTIAGVPEGLRINGRVIPAAAPGVPYVTDVLASHDIAQLQLPGGLEGKHWLLVCQVLAAPSGHYQHAGQVLSSLRQHLPLVEVWGIRGHDSLPIKSDESPVTAMMDRAAGESGLTSRTGGLGSFSNHLSHLFNEGTHAAEHGDLETAVRVILEFHDLESNADPGQATILVKERRRMATPEVVDWLIRMACKPGAAGNIGKAIASLGGDSMPQVLEFLGKTISPRERDALSDVFNHVPNLKSIVVLALRSGVTTMAMGAAEVAARKQMNEAVPALASLLRDNDADVRTAAWHALETIGTREAVEALAHKGR